MLDSPRPFTVCYEWDAFLLKGEAVFSPDDARSPQAVFSIRQGGLAKDDGKHTAQEIFVRRGAPPQAVFLHGQAAQRRMAEIYQLALRTPGIWPL